MKTKCLKIITLIALLTSVFSYSQDWLPKKIVSNGEEGLFLPFSIMDSVSVRLIDRKAVKKENLSLMDLIAICERENSELEDKVVTYEGLVLKWQAQYLDTEKQRALATDNYEKQILITEETKKRSRKKGLVLFSGGVTIGVVAVLVLTR